MIKKYSELFAGAFFVLVGIVIAVQIPSIKLMYVVMDSRLVPKICVVLLIGFGAFLVIQSLFLIHNKKKAREKTGELATKGSISDVNQQETVQEESQKTDSQLKPAFGRLGKWAAPARAGVSLILFGIFIVLLQPLGFILSGIIYLISSFFVMAPTSKIKSPALYIIGVTVPVTVYFLFVYVFKVLLPRGTIW